MELWKFSLCFYDSRLTIRNVSGTLDPELHSAAHLHGRAEQCPSGVLASLAAVMALTGSSVATLTLIRHQGVRINGDEPHYLAESESIGRFFTLNLSPGYSYIITHHIIYPFVAKPGPHVAAVLGNAYLSHHLYLPIRSVGLSVLLSIPVLAGDKVAEMTFIVMLAVVAVGIIHLVSLLANVRSPWRFLAAGLFLTPAYLLATTQIYPDLLTGMVLAVEVLLVALFEVGYRCTRAQVVIGGVLLAITPWLAEKNIPLALLVVVILVVAQRRTSMSVLQLAALAGPALISLATAVCFNMWAYGEPLGIKNPVALTGVETLTRALTLVFDRRSGILIQLPIILLGVAALWTWRRRIPIAVASSVVVAAAAIYGNATEAHSQTGGSFSGRYQWPVVPLALALSALYLFELWKVRRQAVPVIAGIGAVLSMIQSVPVVLNEHLYYSQVPWDPISYRGWWGGLDPSPVLGYLAGAQVYNVAQLSPGVGSGIPTFLPGTIPWHNARNLWGLVCVVMVAVIVVHCLVGLSRRPTRIRTRFVGAGVGVAAACLVLTLTSPVQLPAPVDFLARTLSIQMGTVEGSSVVATGTTDHGTVVIGPSWEVLPGRYETTINYVLEDLIPGVAQGQFVAELPGGSVTVLRSRRLSPKVERSYLTVRVRHAETVAVRVQFNGHGSLKVKNISLAKVTK